MSKENTIISLLKEINKNLDNVSNGGNTSKIKVSGFTVNNECINENGRWEYEQNVDSKYLISLKDAFVNCNTLKHIDLNDWDTSNVTSLHNLFANCSILESVHINNWDVSKVTIINAMFIRCHKLTYVDISNWDASSIKNSTSFNFLFCDCNLLTSIIGNKTIDDVITKNIKCLIGAKYSIPNNLFPKNIDRASLRALINGLADLTGSDTQTLTLGETLIAKLTEEDIAIATAKNWTIA